MKKSLIAVAVLGSFAASAFAAPSVTLYGRIDQGLMYTHTNKDAGDADKFSMESGFSTGSRWGLKGTEDLGNGLKVGFVLESGFTSDDGKLNNGGRLFGREALVSMSGNFGTVYAGRMASILSDAGSLGMLGAVSAFGSGWKDTGTMKGSTGMHMARYDNTLAYATPVWNGFSGKLMYSMKGDQNKTVYLNETEYKNALDGKEAKTKTIDENSGQADRYVAGAVQYKAGPFTGLIGADWYIWGNSNKFGGDFSNKDDGYNILVGGNYQLGNITLFGKANYFDNMQGSFQNTFGKIKVKSFEGWGLEGGVKVANVLGGTVRAAIGYRDAEGKASTGKDGEAGHTSEFKRLNAAAAYEYAFSKRTTAYAYGGWVKEWTKHANKAGDPAQFTVAAGLIHKF